MNRNAAMRFASIVALVIPLACTRAGGAGAGQVEGRDRPDQQLGKPGADARPGRRHLQEAQPGAGQCRHPGRGRDHAAGHRRQRRPRRRRRGRGRHARIRARRAAAHPDAGIHRHPGPLLVRQGRFAAQERQGRHRRNTIAYSTSGSSSNNLVLAFASELGVKAKPTATGGPAATLTQVMSGQIDIGWAAPPFGVKELKEGKIRILIRGSDAPSLRGQTVRSHHRECRRAEEQEGCDHALRAGLSRGGRLDVLRSAGDQDVRRQDEARRTADRRFDQGVPAEVFDADRRDEGHCRHPGATP